MDSVNNIFNKKSYFKQYSGAYVCFLANENMEKLGLKDSTASSFCNGVLKIKVNNFVKLNFESKKETLKRNINEMAKKDLVKRIVTLYSNY